MKIDLKVSVIIAVYKDTEALDLILESLSYQTYKQFEVVIAEDGESEVMRQFVSEARKKYDFAIKHTTQKDRGIRKSASQNNGIRAADGEYLLFIDGDCVLYSTFVEYHVALAEKGFFVGGRRVNLGPKYSTMLRKKELYPLDLEKKFVKNFFDISKDSLESHTEEGFSFSPSSFVYKYILSKRKKKLALLGCNFGCFKEDMEKINGFDEDLGDAAVAADTDIQWRLEAIGLQIKSCKNVANQFHLYHKKDESQERAYPALFLAKKEKNEYICKNGIRKL